MLISQLPPGLKELAEKRRDERDIEFYKRHVDHLFHAFGWRRTPESDTFWSEIDNGNFSVYYSCKVVNCKPKQLRLEVGKTYEDRNGRVILIENFDPKDEYYPFYACNQGRSFTVDGRVWFDKNRPTNQDLIREVK